MKFKRLFTICSAAILAGCSAFSVSASADSVQDFRSVYEVSDKVYALWEECGISISDVQKMMSGTRSSGIKDYGTRLRCISNNPQSESITSELHYMPYELTAFDFVTSSSSVSTETHVITSNPYKIKRLTTISVSSAGVVLKYRYSVATPGTSTSINSVVTQHSLPNPGNNSYTWDFNIPLGDVNGDNDVDISDYMALSNFLAEAYTGTFYPVRADVNMDGSINGTDLALLNQYIAKLIPHIWGNS